MMSFIRDREGEIHYFNCDRQERVTINVGYLVDSQQAVHEITYKPILKV